MATFLKPPTPAPAKKSSCEGRHQNVRSEDQGGTAESKGKEETHSCGMEEVTFGNERHCSQATVLLEIGHRMGKGK